MLKRLSRFSPIHHLHHHRRNLTTTSARMSATPPKQPLPLPGIEESSSKGDGVTELPVGGSVRLDAMGPLVVNNDGSMGRIGNWDGMTDAEKENTVRILGRRNKQRLEALKKKAEAESKKE